MSLATLKTKVGKLIEKAQSGGNTDELEAIIDNSGVLDSTEGTVEEKVEQLIDKANVQGIILSDFSGKYKSPKIADMRSIKIDEQAISNNYDALFSYLFCNVSVHAGWWLSLQEVYLPENIHTFSGYMFQNCISLTTLHGDTSGVQTIIDYAFNNCSKLTIFPYMPSLRVIKRSAFNSCKGLTEVKLYSTLTEFAAAAFYNCTNITDVYVPWSEGEVANAPWGATSAQIHYNTTYDENHEPIITEV